jgi:hypothetical protein
VCPGLVDLGFVLERVAYRWKEGVTLSSSPESDPVCRPLDGVSLLLFFFVVDSLVRGADGGGGDGRVYEYFSPGV